MNDLPDQISPEEASAPILNNQPVNKFSPAIKNKLLTLILVVALISVSVAIIIYFFPRLKKDVKQSDAFPAPIMTPAAHKDLWQTYTNDDLGFSISYPINWESKLFKRDFAYVGKATGVSFRPTELDYLDNDSWGIITIQVEDNISNLTAETYIKNYMLCEGPENCRTDVNTQELIISGVKGIVLSDMSGPIQSKSFIIASSKKLYHISVKLDESFEQSYPTNKKKELFESMINSFKLLSLKDDNVSLQQIIDVLPSNSYTLKQFDAQEWSPNGYCRNLDEEFNSSSDIDCTLLIVTDPQGNQLIVSTPAQFGILVSDTQECFQQKNEQLFLGDLSYNAKVGYHNIDEIVYSPKRIEQGESPYDCSQVETSQSNFQRLNGCVGNLCFWAEKPFDLNEFNKWLLSN